MSPDIKFGQERKSAKVFPVTREAVVKALTSIAENPGAASSQEGGILMSQNINLSLYIQHLSQAFKKDTYLNLNFIEGALWTHKILRTNVELQGGNLPKISRDTTKMMFYDNVDRVNDHTLTSQDFRNIWNAIALNEPHLVQGLSEITKYRPHTDYFYGGAAHLAGAFIKQNNSESLEQKFSK